MTSASAARLYASPWRRCELCHETYFKSPYEFKIHIRNYHCKKEGGSYVCSYGRNNVCCLLPLEGVSEKDYEFHVAKHHVLGVSGDDGKSQEEEFMESLCKKYNVLADHKTSEKPNVVMDQCTWTVYNSSQNLPAVLNDPRRSKPKDLFTKTWGDSFVESAPLPYCPYLPDVTLAHFESYLKHTKKRFHQTSKKNLSRRNSSSKNLTEVQKVIGATAAGSKSSELEEVPQIFLQADFKLEDPEIFSQILPWSELYGTMSDKTTPKNSVKLLQEKLSHFLDIVEVQIARQISMRSEAFFHAMTSHDALMDQLTDVIKSVCALREKIHTIEDVMVKGPMKVLGLKRRQRGYLQIYNKLKLMATVHQTQPTIQRLLSTSDFVGALDLIYTTQDVLVQELAGIHSFRHLSSQLAEMEKVISKMMQSDFVRYITADLNRPPTEHYVMEEDRLIAILFGMLRQNQYNFIPVFKDECFTAVNATVKQTVIEVISKAEDFEIENYTGNLTEELRTLNFEKWLELLQLVLKNLSFLLTRIKALYCVIDGILDVAAGHLSKTSSENSNNCQPQNMMDSEAEVMIMQQDYQESKLNLKDAICSICDHSHDSCAKILTVKSRDGSLDKLNISEFVQLAQSIEKFCLESESMCERQSKPLRLALKNQATKFISRFHEDKKMKLSLILENEQWRQADVPMEFQEIVNQVVTTGKISSAKKSSSEQISEQKPQPYLIVENEQFSVSGTVLMLLKMLIDYCKCAEDIPMLAPDLVNRLLDLFKVFNSRTCQLVLGAGALQVVGLKTITTKHLGLASRCLQLVLYFLPLVKNHFYEKVPIKLKDNVLRHFDRIFKDYSDHIAEINKKLETIIGEMFDVQLRKWEVKAPVPSVHFKSISKQLTKVHELLHDVLPADQIHYIFVRANELFKEKLKFHLSNLQIKNDGGPQHGLVTQELTFYSEFEAIEPSL